MGKIGKCVERRNSICSFDVLQRHPEGKRWSSMGSWRGGIKSRLFLPGQYSSTAPLSQDSLSPRNRRIPAASPFESSVACTRRERIDPLPHLDRTAENKREIHGKSINKVNVLLLSDVLLFLAFKFFKRMPQSNSLEYCQFYCWSEWICSNEGEEEDSPSDRRIKYRLIPSKPSIQVCSIESPPNDGLFVFVEVRWCHNTICRTCHGIDFCSWILHANQ